MSAEPEIPERLTTKVEKENVTLAIDITSERDYKPDEVQRIVEAGGVLIDAKRLKALHDLGCAAEQLGVLRTLRGLVVVGGNGLVIATQKTNEILEDDTGKYSTKEKLDAGRLAGYLAGQMTKLVTGTVKMDRDVVETVMTQDKKTRQSFAPGTAVRLPGS